MIGVLAGGGTFSALRGRDKAFALRLLRETVVWKARLDRALTRYCNVPLQNLDDEVLAALRVGAAQLLVLGTPPHAAVSETVGAVDGGGRGLVNAVLRKLASCGEPDPGSAGDHEMFSHPAHLVEKWRSSFGVSDAGALMEWNNAVPTLGACFKDPPAGLGAGRYMADYRIIDRTGYRPLESLTEPVYIQDEAAVVVGRAAASLAVGGRVLEVGAAPGGKTHHLQVAAEMVVSMDCNAARAARWLENSRRLGWRSCFPVVGDGTLPPLAAGFDLVFLDAPCTNTGVFRRRPEARWKWSPAYLGGMVKMQRDLLTGSAAMVKPGGFLVYSTCSLEPEENVEQVRWFEEHVKGFTGVGLPAPPQLVSKGMISIFPPEHGIDGMFAAAWRRDG